MGDYLSRLGMRVLGTAPAARPRGASLFAPEPAWAPEPAVEHSAEPPDGIATAHSVHADADRVDADVPRAPAPPASPVVEGWGRSVMENSPNAPWDKPFAAHPPSPSLVPGDDRAAAATEGAHSREPLVPGAALQAVKRTEAGHTRAAAAPQREVSSSAGGPPLASDIALHVAKRTEAENTRATPMPRREERSSSAGSPSIRAMDGEPEIPMPPAPPRTRASAPAPLVRMAAGQQRDGATSPSRLTAGTRQENQTPASHPQMHADAEAPIHVTIGRIEVRAVAPPAPPRAKRASTRISLDDYLKRGGRAP